MSELVDKPTRLAAMANLTKHFLSLAYSTENIPSEQRARHEAAKAELVSCKDRFDAHDLIWLFYHLEERALAEISKLAALAQTTDPEAMLQYGLPREIVRNAKLLMEHNGMQAKVASVSKARASKQDAKVKIEFQEWAKKNIELKTHSGKIQIEDVRGMKGFEASWGQSDVTLKRWLKEAIPGFSFKRGARKK